MKKIWKKIPNFSLYEASNFGEIKTYNWKNKGIERIMRPALDGGGYLRTVLINDNGIKETVKVHRIIATTFIEKCSGKPHVNHLNCIKTDNRVSNLEWCTISDNILHAYKMKAMTNKGECNPCATLTDKQVIEIRNNYVYGKKSSKGPGLSKRQIAEKYGTTFSVIKRIIQGKTWKHLL